MAEEIYTEIRSFLAGGMDSDSAPENVENPDYISATNFMTTGAKGAQLGYGTNVPGNTLLAGSLLPGINDVIGGGRFEETNQIVGFRYNTAGNHQILLYNSVAGVYSVIFTDKTDSGGVALLAGLNPQNEVRAILVNDTYLIWWAKGLEVGYTNLTTLAAGGYGSTVLDEDLSLLKPPCLIPPTGVYGNDPGQPANFLYGNLPQFIVQYVNADYNYYAWSTWSQRIVPYQQNTPTLGADVGQNNYIIVSVNIGSIRGATINIGCRFALNTFFTCKSVDRTYVLALPNTSVNIATQVYEAYNPATNTYSFAFYNNEIQLPIDANETDLLYDYIWPANAGALINGNIAALGDWQTLYARPAITATVAAIGYGANINIPPGSTTGRLQVAVINPGQSGSGAGNHRRIIELQFSGSPQTGDYITLITADIRNANVTENYSRTVSASENGNLAQLVNDIAAQVPNGTVTNFGGGFYGVTFIDNPYFTLQTFSVALHYTGATVANSIPTVLDNCPYQVAIAWYDAKGGRPFPIQVIGQVATPSYAQVNGQAIKLIINIATLTAPIGAASYQILLTKPPVNSLIDVLGSFISFKGVWNAHTNSPTLSVNSGSIGDTYQVGVPDSPASSTYTNLGNNETYNTGDYIVDIGGSSGIAAAGQYYKVLPSTFGNIAGGDILCLSLNSLALYNYDYSQQNVSTQLTYDFNAGDRCTFHYWIDTSGNINYFNSPCVNVAVLGYDAASYIVKLEKSQAFTISGGTITYNGQEIDTRNIFFRLYSPAQLAQSQSTTEQTTVYYEIGSQYPVINGQHSQTTIEVTNGGAYYKTRQYNDALQPFAVSPHQVLATDLNYSDFYLSTYYSFGRPRTYDDVLEQAEQKASIIPSQNYILGSKKNGLNRFYPEGIYGEGNGQCSSSWGAIQILWQRGDVLCVIQERNTFYIPVNYAWTILNDQITGQSISEKLLNNGRYSDRGIGIGIAKESFWTRYDNAGFVDPFKGLPMEMQINDIQPIDGRMSKFFKTVLPQAYAQGLKIHQYYDDYYEQVVMCIQAPSGKLVYFPFDTAEWNPNDDYTIVPADVTATPNGAHCTAAYNATTGVVTYTPSTGYVGSDSATFTATTGSGPVTKNNCLQWIAGVTTVNPFYFAPLINQPLSTEIPSNTIGVIGNNVPVPISITGGQYSVNGGAFTSAPGIVNPYDSVQVEVLSSSSNGTSTSCTLTISSQSATFTVTTFAYQNVAINANYRKTGCPTGYTGTFVYEQIPAGAYTSNISQADADAQANAAAQADANSKGTCLLNATLSTVLVDYLTDTTSDLCCFVATFGLAETGLIVTGTAETPSGPLLLPNNGTDPSQCYLLSSDKLGSTSPAWRFGINLAYFVQKYGGGSLTSITFRVQGRDASAGVCSLSYAARPITQGYLVLGGTTGARIPGVSMGSTTPTTVSSHITNGADGTVGTSVGLPVLDIIYTFATMSTPDSISVTTY